MRGPGERPPVEPISATQHTPEGAKAFAEFFIKTIDWGYATTSSTYMRHYFSSSCKQCQLVATLLDSAHQKHAHYIGGRVSIKNSRLISFGAPSSVDLRVLVTSDEVVDAQSKPIDADTAYPNLPERVEMSWHAGQWSVTDMRGAS